MSTGARGGLFVAALAGFGAGLAGGLFGVGGGIVMVPVLTAFFGLTQHQAHGTSLAAVAATALAGIVVYGLAGHVAWLPAALMAVSGAWTARIGARLAHRTAHERLTLAFAVFILAVGVRILWRVPVHAGECGLAGGPFSGPSRMRWTLLRAGQVELAIVDVTGRHVRRLVSGTFAAGTHEFAWDGRDDDGRVVRAGAYFMAGTISGERTSQRLFLLH